MKQYQEVRCPLRTWNMGPRRRGCRKCQSRNPQGAVVKKRGCEQRTGRVQREEGAQHSAPHGIHYKRLCQ